MSELSIFVLEVGFAAFAIWLAVRIVNRREKWARWTAGCLAVVLVAYLFSYGPACWVTARPRFGVVKGFDAMVIFWPLGRAAQHKTSFGGVVRWWMLTGCPSGYVVAVPTTLDRATYIVLKNGP